MGSVCGGHENMGDEIHGIYIRLQLLVIILDNVGSNAVLRNRDFETLKRDQIHFAAKLSPQPRVI